MDCVGPLPKAKSRYENPQKLTQLSQRSHPRHLVGKRTAQKDVIKDITSDSQVNSYFPYRWSPASLTLNIYFYLFLYLYITIITIKNGTPHLKPPKNQNRRTANSGNEYLLITMRASTGFPETIPLRNIKTKTIMKAIVKVRHLCRPP